MYSYYNLFNIVNIIWSFTLFYNIKQLCIVKQNYIAHDYHIFFNVIKTLSMGIIYLEVILVKLKEIMSKEIASLSSDDSIKKAAQLMKQYNIGSLPVCKQKSVVGIVTDRDIALRSVAAGQNSSQQTVSEIMTANPVVGTPDMDVHEAVKIMSEKQIRRLPVVDNNSLVGFVSLGDISVEPTLQDNAEQALKNISQPATNRFS